MAVVQINAKLRVKNKKTNMHPNRDGPKKPQARREKGLVR